MKQHHPLSIGISLAPTWWRGEAWRAAHSGVEQLFDLAPYAELARAAERAHLDFVFVPDAGYLRRDDLAHSPGFSTLESLTLVSALAGLTQRIGLVPTVQTTVAHPYATARALQSLNQLSGGRAGWNAVTALGGNENYGLDAAPSSTERYARAAEFVDVVRRLWESYPADALLLDRERGAFADLERIRPLTPHTADGAHFQVAGPLPIAAHPAGELPLFQAGGSPAGVAFAGRTADAVFALAPTLDDAITQRRDLRDAAERAGRDPAAVRLLPGLSYWHADRPGTAETPTGPGARHWTIVGPPRHAADEIQRWSAAGSIDGLILLPAADRSATDTFMHDVVPELATRGLFRGPYTGATLRSHLGLDSILEDSGST
ncbi:MAG: LLM class flavin-dependent oxidoreductase [Micrococcaceae bacterium]